MAFKTELAASWAEARSEPWLECRADGSLTPDSNSLLPLIVASVHLQWQDSGKENSIKLQM